MGGRMAWNRQASWGRFFGDGSRASGVWKEHLCLWYEKLILTGKEAIRRYLAACQSSGKATPNVTEIPAPKKESTSKSGDFGLVWPLPHLGGPNILFNPSTDEGVCKEEQKCD
jgi:hypothetical protein